MKERRDTIIYTYRHILYIHSIPTRSIMNTFRLLTLCQVLSGRRQRQIKKSIITNIQMCPNRWNMHKSFHEKAVNKWQKVLFEFFGGHSYVGFTFHYQDKRQCPFPRLETKSLFSSMNWDKKAHHLFSKIGIKEEE